MLYLKGMGRNSTGAVAVNEVMRIELSFMLKMGYIKQGHTIQSTMSWTGGGEIWFKSYLEDDRGYLRLKYNIVDRSTQKQTKYDYEIPLTSLPSNLGAGRVPYFVCPQSFKRCRVLYKCYGSDIWKSRQAYQNRIYYRSQQCSKLDYHNTRYWTLESQLEKLDKPRKKTYRGILTKLQQRKFMLQNKLWWHDERRWLCMPKRFMALMGKEGGF
jgi:hypothetical protein